MADKLKEKFSDEINDKTNISDLSKGQLYSSHEVARIFKVSERGGGIRTSKTTGTIVITQHHGNCIYEDRWLDSILHYTGFGQKCNQTLSCESKSIYEAKENSIVMHLFEASRTNEYFYHAS